MHGQSVGFAQRQQGRLVAGSHSIGLSWLEAGADALARAERRKP